MKRMILDLRNNPGGIVDQAVAVASNFVPKDSVIVSLRADPVTNRNIRLMAVVILSLW